MRAGNSCVARTKLTQPIEYDLGGCWVLAAIFLIFLVSHCLSFTSATGIEILPSDVKIAHRNAEAIGEHNPAFGR